MAVLIFIDTFSYFIILNTWIILRSIIKIRPSIFYKFIILLNEFTNVIGFINHCYLTFKFLKLRSFRNLLKRLIWKEWRFTIKWHIVIISATSCLVSCYQLIYFFLCFFSSLIRIFALIHFLLFFKYFTCIWKLSISIVRIKIIEKMIILFCESIISVRTSHLVTLLLF